jgi:hypothetical protein
MLRNSGLPEFRGVETGFRSQLEHFQAKWEPVRRPEMRQFKEIERFRDPTQTESALMPSFAEMLPWMISLGENS